MGILNNISGPSGPPQELNRSDAGAHGVRPGDSAAADVAFDRLELSDAGVRLAQIDERPDARVQRVRSEIAEGMYESDHRIDATIERLFADLTAFETQV